MCADAEVQQEFQRRSKYVLHRNTAYYFNDLERILSESYVPTAIDRLLRGFLHL